MFVRRGRHARANCEHTQAISVRSASIERVVCERCGHLSFYVSDDLSETPRRAQFERVAEKPQRALR